MVEVELVGVVEEVGLVEVVVGVVEVVRVVDEGGRGDACFQAGLEEMFSSTFLFSPPYRFHIALHIKRTPRTLLNRRSDA